MIAVLRLQSEDYQIGALFAFILLFTAAEKAWPAHRVNPWKDLKVDVLSFGVALVVNRLATYLILGTVGDITPRLLRGIIDGLEGLPSAARITLALFAVDFSVYWVHRSQHRWNLMWRTHAWHHSIEEMYWFAGFRTSFFHSLLNNIPQVLIPVTLFRFSPAEAGVGYSIGLFILFIEHTNCRVTWGPLNWLLITPEYHRIHHAAAIHHGKNLAGMFRIWDVMFGTYVDPAEVKEDYPLGLGEVSLDSRNVARMLVGV